MEKMESHFFSNHLVVITVHFHFIAMTFGMFKKMKNTQNCNNNISMIVGLENYNCKKSNNVTQCHLMSLNVT